MAHIDFMALMAAENWEPYLALMLATATAGQFAAGDTSVGFGPYSPDFNPIEYLWKKVKKMATHLKHFPEFTRLQAEVDKALLHFAQTPHEIMALMTRYCDSLGALAA